MWLKIGSEPRSRLSSPLALIGGVSPWRQCFLRPRIDGRFFVFKNGFGRGVSLRKWWRETVRRLHLLSSSGNHIYKKYIYIYFHHFPSLIIFWFVYHCPLFIHHLWSLSMDIHMTAFFRRLGRTASPQLWAKRRVLFGQRLQRSIGWGFMGLCEYGIS